MMYGLKTCASIALWFLYRRQPAAASSFPHTYAAASPSVAEGPVTQLCRFKQDRSALFTVPCEFLSFRTPESHPLSVASPPGSTRPDCS